MELPLQPYFSPHERTCLEQRTLSDAKLIKKGATFNQVGTLILLTEQIIEEAQERWLTMPVLLNNSRGPKTTSLTLSNRAANALLRDGLRTARDLYVTGRDYVSDIPNLGQKSLDEVDAALVPGTEVGLSWKEAPDIADIAAVTHDLTEVTANVLRTGNGTQKRVWMSVVGLNKVNSVQDALNLTPQILSPRQSSDRPYYPQILLPAIKSAAEQFAEKYNQYK